MEVTAAADFAAQLLPIACGATPPTFEFDVPRGCATIEATHRLADQQALHLTVSANGAQAMLEVGAGQDAKGLAEQFERVKAGS